MPGFDSNVLFCENVDFREAATVTGQVTANGQLLIGAAAAPFLRVATLASADGSITITNGPGTIDLALTAAGVEWNYITLSQALVNKNGYICGTGGGVISLSLPASAAVGDTIEVALSGATSWTITQGAGQRIRLANAQTTSGVGGSLASTAQGDWVQLVCDVSGTHWVANAKSGNITIV